MRVLLLLLVLTTLAWGQTSSLEFPCDPVDATVSLDEVLLGPVNQELRVNKETLPEKGTLIYRRPGWREARVEVTRKDLEGKFYPPRGNVVCLTSGTTLIDRWHQFLYAASGNFFWFGFIIVLTTLVGIGQRAMEKRNAPRGLGASRG